MMLAKQGRGWLMLASFRVPHTAAPMFTGLGRALRAY